MTRFSIKPFKKLKIFGLRNSQLKKQLYKWEYTDYKCWICKTCASYFMCILRDDIEDRSLCCTDISGPFTTSNSKVGGSSPKHCSP